MRIVELLDSSGTKIDHFEGEECSAKITRELNGLWQLDFQYPIPRYNSKDANLLSDYRLRVYDLDASTYITFVINTVRRSKAGNSRVEIIADHYLMTSLGITVFNNHADFKSATPSNILTTLLTYSSPALTIGTVNITIPITLTLSYESILSCLVKLSNAVSGYYDINEATMTVDLKSSLGTDNGVRITPDSNMRSLLKATVGIDRRNKIFGVGGGEPPLTIGYAAHRVSSYAAGVIVCVGDKIVPENDFWNGKYILFLTGDLAQGFKTITDCAHNSGSNDTISFTLGASPAPSAGDLFCFMSSAVTPIDYIGMGTATRADVYINSNWQAITNLLKTPALDGTYTLGICQDWNIVDTPTCSENTNAAYIKYGTKSQKIVASTISQGISQYLKHKKPNSIYSISANIYLVSGSVALALDASVTTFYAISTAVSGSDPAGWRTLALEGLLTPDNDITVYIVSLEAAEFYVDSVQFSFNKTPQRFANPCERKALWDETFDICQKRNAAKITHDCSFIDLYRLADKLYPYHKISLGDTLNVIDTELAIDEEVVVVKDIDDVFSPEKRECVISNE